MDDTRLKEYVWKKHVHVLVKTQGYNQYASVRNTECKQKATNALLKPDATFLIVNNAVKTQTNKVLAPFSVPFDLRTTVPNPSTEDKYLDSQEIFYEAWLL